MFDRLVNFHGLNNLVWVYNTNEFKDGVDSHEIYYPGTTLWTYLPLDVYTEGFDQLNYNQTLELAGDNPIALGEVGMPPSFELLQDQPRWTWFMKWGKPGNRSRSATDEGELFRSDPVIVHGELPWVSIKEATLHHPVMK